MNIQRLRNLTTGRLHTDIGHVYEDLETITGERGLMTHMLPRAARAAERERCAKLCESFGCPQDRVAFADGFNAAKYACAYWIRTGYVLGPNVPVEAGQTACRLTSPRTGG